MHFRCLNHVYIYRQIRDEADQIQQSVFSLVKKEILRISYLMKVERVSRDGVPKGFQNMIVNTRFMNIYCQRFYRTPKLPDGIYSSGHKGKQIRGQTTLYKSSESGKSDIINMKLFVAPQLSFKLRYNFSDIR